MPFLCLHAAGKDGLMKDEIFSVLQRVGRSFMLPVAVLPIAGILLGIGASFTNPTTIKTYGLEAIFGDGTLLGGLLTIMASAGSTIFGNLPIIFAVGVAIGMAKISFNIDLLYIIIPGYVLALVLMWLGDNDLVGITFDAGGVATGPMSVAIIGTMYTGIAASKYNGSLAVINGFGVIALIAIAPIIFLGFFSIYIKAMKRRSSV